MGSEKRTLCATKKKTILYDHSSRGNELFNVSEKQLFILSKSIFKRCSKLRYAITKTHKNKYLQLRHSDSEMLVMQMPIFRPALYDIGRGR